MDRIFIPIYRFFERRKWVMYLVLVLTSLTFVAFGLQVQYEEDISKLLPQTDKATESGLAFSNLRVKDKIFLQIVSKNGAKSPDELSAACDAFVDGLLTCDTAYGYVSNILYRIDDDVLFMGMDYALQELPTLVDTACYSRFDALLTQEAIDIQMAENVRMLQADVDGSVAELVTQDPLALRKALLPEGQSAVNALGGFSLINRHFFTPDSTVVLAFLSPNFESFDSKTGTYLVNMLEEQIEQFTTANPDYEILFHGAPVQSVFNSRQIKKDLLLTIGLSLIIICIVVAWSFKTKSTLLLLLSPVVYGAFFSLACMYWIKGTMSLLAVGIGAIVLGVALSYCLHVLTHSKYVADPIQLLKDQSTPVCLGCLTTIGAFAGLLFTQSDLLKDFGLFASFALIGTTLFALIFLPHFFGPKQLDHSAKAFALLDKINSYPLDRNKWLIAFILVVCAVCFYTSTWVTFDSDLKHIGYNEPKVLRSQALYADKNNNGCASMYYAATAETLDSALTYSGAIVRVCDSLEREGIVARFTNVSALLLTESEQQQRIDTWEKYWSEQRVSDVRHKVAQAAQRNGLDAMLFEPFFTLLEADYAPASLVEAGVLPESLLSNFVEETGGQYMVFTSVLMPESERQKVNDAIAAERHTVVIDPFYYTNDMVRIVNDDFNIVLLISSLFVFVVLLVSFKSLSRALLAFLPMFLSWYIVEGVMGICGLQFNLINIVISSFIFGVGVDYSIFVMDGLLADTRRNDTHLLMYHKTAISLSAFVLLVVVTSLLFATHPALRSVGVSTLIGMTSTVLITYTLQPWLFRLLANSKFFARRFGRKPRFKNTKDNTTN
ncbi:MAG: MMPL family transporter [Paludibacteraceae bacterium]